MDWFALVATLLQAGGGFAELATFLQQRFGAVPPAELMKIAGRLPPNADARAIQAAIGPAVGFGGNVHVSAGNDGGGDARLTNAFVSGGDGSRRGGDVVIKAGDGGPHGKGGDTVVVGGTIKGGDAR